MGTAKMILWQSLIAVTMVFMVFMQEANTKPQRWRGPPGYGQQFWPRNTYHRSAKSMPAEWWYGIGNRNYRGPGQRPPTEFEEWDWPPRRNRNHPPDDECSYWWCKK